MSTDIDYPAQLKVRKGLVLGQISMLPVVRVANAEHSQFTTRDSAPIVTFEFFFEFFRDNSISGVDEILFQSRMCVLVLRGPHHPS